MQTNQKKVFVTASILLALIGVALGAVLLVLAALLKPDTVDNIVRGVMIVCGIVTVIGNIPGLVSGISNMKNSIGIADLITSTLGILFGVMLIVYQGKALAVVIGVYLIVFPLLLILFSKNKKATFKANWPRMALGVAILILLPLIVWTVFEAVHIILTVLGWAVIGLSVLLGIIGVIRALRMSNGTNWAINRTQNKKGKKIYVDQTGDGVVDVILNDDEQNG